MSWNSWLAPFLNSASSGGLRIPVTRILYQPERPGARPISTGCVSPIELTLRSVMPHERAMLPRTAEPPPHRRLEPFRSSG
jgi:hypothetical protein